MSGNGIFVLPEANQEATTGIQVMLLSDAEVCMVTAVEPVERLRHSCWNKTKEVKTVCEPDALRAINKTFDERLYNILIDTCLQNPYWSDFRMLDFFCKRGIPITMERLQQLRRECCLESREDVCQELMRLYFNNKIQMDKRQIQFIERVNPAFRDRDFWATRPGELLVYECVFFRRLNTMFYLHLVFDLFNGYVFGKVSRRRSGEVALKLLHDKIVPFYRSRGYTVGTVIHSTRSARDRAEAEASEIHKGILAMGIDWLEPQHAFGIIQCFQRDVLEHFFYGAEALELSLFVIQPALNRWMIQYNAVCPFHQRRNLIGYHELVGNRACM